MLPDVVLKSRESLLPGEIGGPTDTPGHIVKNQPVGIA